MGQTINFELIGMLIMFPPFNVTFTKVVVKHGILVDTYRKS